MNLFGKAKKQNASNPNESIARLRDTLATLEKREAYLVKKITNETNDAKKYIKQKNKRAAMMCIKRRKTYENQIDKLSGARITIERQVLLIEDANVSLEVMNAMKMGAETIKEMHGHMSLDQVDNTMEDIREQMEIANEINEAISQPVGFGVDFDEDELNEELELLEQESLESDLLDIDTTGQKDLGTGAKEQESVTTALDSLPAAGTSNPAPKKAAKTEDDELAALQADMAL
eukprot:TRINITY_DN3961_c0_g1_i1.p1 TRINITY_DN3961_c0_g1~~TRINITY_DN3961_c0_g1_i1.p1  ORF type:complete len:233 (+),score=76.26 TRINITY_DN3961_c0_g1_i1:311-1009(+)